MRYLLEVRTRSPLVIAARPTTIGLPTESRRYIPGTTLRGALAAKLLREGANPGSQRFRELFLDGKVRYGNLYPVSRGMSLDQRMARSLPLPATAVTCKWQPGFASTDVIPDQGHGVFDTLITHLATDDLEVPKQCGRTGCGADLEPFSGFYETDNATMSRQALPGGRLISRTAMDSILGAAKGEALYTLQAINEQESFSGYIEVDPSLKDALQRILDNARLRMGSDRTRGLGDVEVHRLTLADGEASGLEDGVEARLSTFEGALQTQGGLVESFKQEAELNRGSWIIFPLTLYSDAIVLNEYMQYQTVIDAGALQMYSRCWPAEVPKWPNRIRLIRAFTSTSMVAGWNSAHKLPKPKTMVIDRGSVFVFAAPASERDTLTACLNRLESDGIGERRSEGFGQGVVGHPFHLRKEQDNATT